MSRSGEQRMNGRLRKAARRTHPCPKRAVEPAIEGAASRNYRARISDILDGARSVGRDVDGDPSE